jgi:hypothetical protein
MRNAVFFTTSLGCFEYLKLVQRLALETGERHYDLNNSEVMFAWTEGAWANLENTVKWDIHEIIEESSDYSDFLYVNTIKDDSMELAGCYQSVFIKPILTIEVKK